jgi:hypothetical protein
VFFGDPFSYHRGMNPSDPVVAAFIGAFATVMGALVQLRISWRKEMRERERGQPISRKQRRGPVLLVFALMIASAVGGFALSQYLMSLRYGDQDAIRAELQAKLNEIAASAARLEHARLGDRPQAAVVTAGAEAPREPEDGATGSIVVAPCKTHDCNEQGAVRVAVCARVPAAATVKEVQLYTRLEDSQQPWAEARVQAGQDAGQAKFVEKFYERSDIDGSKQVCQSFASWNGEKARLARILVKYAL